MNRRRFLSFLAGAVTVGPSLVAEAVGSLASPQPIVGEWLPFRIVSPWYEMPPGLTKLAVDDRVVTIVLRGELVHV